MREQTQAIRVLKKFLNEFLSGGCTACVFIILFFLVQPVVFALPCPFCRAENPDGASLCNFCLRAISWPVYPERSRSAEIIVRTGIDVFLRGPDDGIPPNQPTRRNTGYDRTGPLGSFSSKTGFRYLIRFDIPAAFDGAHSRMAEFSVTRVTLVLHLAGEGEKGIGREDAHDEVPVAVFPLTRPFAEGIGESGGHRRDEGGADWYHADPWIPWTRQGGDYAFEPSAKAVLPRLGGDEVEIDVTAIYQRLFERFRKTGVWEDPGLIIMRDPSVDRRCQYRTIYGFQAAPEDSEAVPLKGSKAPRIRSPELFIE
ncbi:MAG: hypothetical protein WA705_27985 [Candidatus Ozemobacteraceae bacterium]